MEAGCTTHSQKKGFDGAVFVPEFRGGVGSAIYDKHAVFEWETNGLNRADCILFWIPRNLKTLPAFTTNVEFGLWIKSGKCIFGAPKSAPKIEYLKKHAGVNGNPFYETLEKTMNAALSFLGDGIERERGECDVPFYIWKTHSFQHWYSALRRAGNRLDGARVEWIFRVGPQKNIVFLWILHVNVYVASEKRNKINEVVISRPDIATVLLYKPDANMMQSKIVLIREFRSPVANDTGYVWEVPGGSSFNQKNSLIQIAHDEVYEETGLVLERERMREHKQRQLAATFSAHTAFLFSYELTDEELKWLYSQKGIAHGEKESSERTYIEICTLEDIMRKQLVDWSMLGMICAVLYGGPK